MQKNALKIGKKFNNLFDELKDVYGEESAGKVQVLANQNLKNYEQKFPDIPEGEWMHVEKIFPTAAVYTAMAEIFGKEKALEHIMEYGEKRAAAVGKKLRIPTNVPGMAWVFMKVFDYGLKKSFGEKNGFKQVSYEMSGKEMRFDITQCPYCKYTKELGVEELAAMSCASDDYCYGNLDRIGFYRTKTLGRGDDCCDFCLKLKKRNEE